MGRKVVFSAMVLAGLGQMTPAIAQIEDRQDDWGRSHTPSAPADAPDVEDVAPAPIAAEKRSAAPAQVADAQPDPEPTASPVVEARSSAAAEAPVAVAEVKVREPDLADKDLAIAPPEEARPVLVDPTAARRVVASSSRRAQPMPDDARPAPEPVLAAARRAPEPIVDEQDRETAPAPAERVAAAPPRPVADERALEPVYAARAPIAAPVERVEATPVRPVPEYRDARPGRGGQYRAPAPVSTERAARTGPDEREQYRRAASAAMERATPAYPAETADAFPAEEERMPASRPVYARQDDHPPSSRIAEAAPPPLPARRPAYADRRAPFPTASAAEPGEPGYEDRDTPPAYAEDDRQAPPGYPQDSRLPSRGYDDRDLPTDEAYAVADRADREPAVRGASYGRAWGDREVATTCGRDRADRLQQRLRRDIADRRIDWRTARDLEAEIGHIEEMQRSYCSSGLNAWREERLDRQYAQIEDRLRYEEDRGGWR